MQSTMTEQRVNVLTPIRLNERIHALDVIRGVALLGIFLMNIEYFNRALATLSRGLPANLVGADAWVSVLIYSLVQGKFWTLFSLLFGMGFAVMLTRAERAERDFLGPYLRRIGALALFGTIHYIFIWAGDILFSYAVAASGLLILMYGRAKYIIPSVIVLIVTGTVFEMELFQGMAASLALLGALALFLRSDRVIKIGRWSFPMKKLQQPNNNQRMRRLGAFMYLFPFVMMALGSMAQIYFPHPEENITEQVKLEERVKENEAQIREETQVMSRGTYKQAVELRIKTFSSDASEHVGFAVIVVGMFLIGAWFVRSGIMENTGAQLVLFRRLALYGTPIGLGLGLLGSAIATSWVPGQERAPYQLAISLAMLGNLPACLGYASIIVLMLHSSGPLSKIRVLAPAGRMALTNYLTQSLLGTLVFYGYGLGYWGAGRVKQLVFVVIVFSLQVVFSHWWLARFHYGPMEWLWRAITYWQWPPMRRRIASA